MTEKELLADCLRRLNRAGVPYMLTGSMASNCWGIPYLRRWAEELSVSDILADLLEGKIRPKQT